MGAVEKQMRDTAGLTPGADGNRGDASRAPAAPRLYINIPSIFLFNCRRQSTKMNRSLVFGNGDASTHGPLTSLPSSPPPPPNPQQATLPNPRRAGPVL
jgi:hypothetical protein